MATNPLVSVVVPTYGQAQYLPICLDSIWHQDYKPLEIIVVNAASPDGTKEVLEEYQKAIDSDEVSFASRYDEEKDSVERQYHPRFPKDGRTLRIINLDSDPGVVETYNIGLREAKGEFVATVASDDVCHPMMMSMLAEGLSHGADFAYSDLIIVDDAGRIVRKFEFPDYDFKACLADWYLMGVSRMWRRSLHDECGYMLPEWKLVHDYEMILRFAKSGAKFEHIAKVLYSIRWHGPDRKTGNHSPDREPKIHTESKKVAMMAREWLG